ncbi:uncharacterized protein L3040_007649 [Drepanopeziza brunnea f. sp. 'multigermtubi']|uniref:Uncharacterized protein n=1 Tax=Marssonina brunnea f. sp. multigermtubi (strain MB_m1) TaxID=1072389 RepID=K1WZV6_MARBU|nr:uncharacterized protein MBM_03949 [Drepanopeziza brunnea f. sp. 'multigermtubi' MB_m1]EKD18177.1 hypothetical protein MBM_03949 [Drepanopeziza brunnea f. sp. 'multigermtubi' MB_m1]KAJ5037475.1 hypothetical protein L3040_007649 [Drepanopeziza brunnea f. sp. 'multigermtubi']
MGKRDRSAKKKEKWATDVDNWEKLDAGGGDGGADGAESVASPGKDGEEVPEGEATLREVGVGSSVAVEEDPTGREERKKSAAVEPLLVEGLKGSKEMGGMGIEGGNEEEEELGGLERPPPLVLSWFEAWKRERAGLGPCHSPNAELESRDADGGRKISIAKAYESLVAGEERRESAEVLPLKLGKKREEERMGMFGGWSEAGVESGKGTSVDNIGGEDKEKRISGKKGVQPKNILIPPGGTDEARLGGGGLLSRSSGCPIAIRIIINAAETYLHWVESSRGHKNDKLPDSLIMDSQASRERFDLVMAHLDEARCNATSPLSPIDDDKPDNTPGPEIPEDLNAEFGELYVECQRYVDDKMAGLAAVSQSEIRDMHREIMDWYRKMVMAGTDDQDFSKTDEKTREAERQMRILLRRMFDGFAHHHGVLKQLGNNDQEAPIAGYKRVIEAAEDSIPYFRVFSTVGRFVAAIAVIFVLLASADWFINTWIPWLFSLTSKGVSPNRFALPDYQSKPDSISWAPSFESSLETCGKQLGTTKKFYDAANAHTFTVLGGLHNLTRKFTSDTEGLALKSVWSVVASLTPLARLLGSTPLGETREAIHTTATKYLDEVGRLTSHIPASRRTLQNALEGLDAGLAALKRREGDGPASRCSQAWSPLGLWRKTDCQFMTSLVARSTVERVRFIKGEVGEMQKSSQEGVFELYDQIKGWEGTVRRAVQGGLGGEESWWKVMVVVREAEKALGKGAEEILRRIRGGEEESGGDFVRAVGG